MADMFKSLGDPTRLSIFSLLASHSEKKLCVCCIAKKLGISQPAISQHLKVLKNVGLVDPNREGFKVHYSINKDVLITFKNDWEVLCKLDSNDILCPEKDVCKKENN